MTALLNALRNAGRTVRSMAGVLVGIVIIAGAIWLGSRQGKQSGDAGFDSPPAAPQAPRPFQSDQDTAAKLNDKDAFAHTCGTCHTLRAAGVTAQIGPDLDRSDRKLTFAAVRRQIRDGSLDGSMPANLLTGKDADRVARYVARVVR
jgi:mono/diheme cytochrome c family protein